MTVKNSYSNKNIDMAKAAESRTKELFNFSDEHKVEGQLALMFSRVTEAAALASSPWMGRGEKELADNAATSAMRKCLSTVPINGSVIIGEGEKDNAPMLYRGEKLGNNDDDSIEVDIAVDPVEGTRLLAYGQNNAISTIVATPKGMMFDPGPSFYMEKIVAPKEAYGCLDLSAPIAENLKKVAKALDKPIDQLTVFVLNKPRHKDLIAEIRRVGARIRLESDGDVAGAICAVDKRVSIDMLIGTGGTPEGVIAACAVRAMRGQMLSRFNPQSAAEMHNVLDAGFDLKDIFSEKDLIKSEDCWFSATGITEGDLLKGVRYNNNHAITNSLTIRGATKTVRYIETMLDLSDLPEQKLPKL